MAGLGGGELADAVVRNRGSLEEEAADMLACFLSLCNIEGIGLERSFLEKYGNGLLDAGQSHDVYRDG
jgi:NTP pyrophosphatase (non-canonical NTP hydrolase)